MDELKAIFEAQRAATRRVCVMLQHEAANNWRIAQTRLFLAQLTHTAAAEVDRRVARTHQELAASEYRAIREAMGVE